MIFKVPHFLWNAVIGKQIPNYGPAPMRAPPSTGFRGPPNIAAWPIKGLSPDLFEPNIGPHGALMGPITIADAALMHNIYVNGLYTRPVTGVS